jgi:RNA polymerase sigma factor (sigma-70 family)
MSQASSNAIMQLFRDVCADARSDTELLDRFVAERDEGAFESLVRRHGPMVLDICRGRLANEADAEDAFQATFFVLARNGRSIRKTASLASWLHGVALRIALQAQTEKARRQRHEPRAAESIAVHFADDLSWREVQLIIHEEVDRLPERLKAPLVLCYLQGIGQDQAALELGLPKGTLKGRLERAREQLRNRLVRRGLGSTALLLATVWPVAAALPFSLASQTANAVVAVSGQGGGVLSAQILALMAAADRDLVSKPMMKLAVLSLAVGICLSAYFLTAPLPYDRPLRVRTMPALPSVSTVATTNAADGKQADPQAGNNAIAREFTCIQLLSPAKITIRKGDRCAVVVSGKARPTLQIDEGVLTLGNFEADEPAPFECTIDVKDLKEIVVTAVGMTQIDGLDAREVAISIRGAGALIISGKAESLDLSIAGIGGFDGLRLKAETARVTHSGIADVLVNARKSLDVTLTGVGNVEYVGSPEVRESIMGFGQVISRLP